MNFKNRSFQKPYKKRQLECQDESIDLEEEDSVEEDLEEYLEHSERRLGELSSECQSLRKALEHLLLFCDKLYLSSGLKCQSSHKDLGMAIESATECLQKDGVPSLSCGQPRLLL